MPPSIIVGTARSQPGQIVYGQFDAVPLPTGGTDIFPVIIAQGKSGSGPVLWLTSNIHGNEYNGLVVIHQLITPDLVAAMTGTIVAIPTLSPAGLRIGERSPYYGFGKDPNRLFPSMPSNEESPDGLPPSGLELAYARLFERIDATADFLLDLHDYGIRAIPFAFRDPIFYREARDRIVAQKLQDTVGEMLDALGLTIVNEYASERYLEMNLHRSVSGSALNRARIPAVTIEIGGQRAVTPLHVQAVVTGIRNVMRWAGMLSDSRESMPDVPVVDLGYPVRRTTHPRVPNACLIHFLVQPGEIVHEGDPVARMVDIYGRSIGPGDGLLRVDHDGFIIGLFPGITCYPNDAIMGLAIRDTNSLIIPVSRL